MLFKDITEHKKAEEALFESEEKYEQLVDKLPEMVFELDKTGRVIFANLRATEIIGYSKEELGKILMLIVLSPLRMLSVQGKI